MDEAFTPLHDLLVALLPAQDEIVDEAAGVRSVITRYEVGSPVELDVTLAPTGADGAAGALQIGSAPPLYYVDTSLRPSFHHIRFVVERGGPDAA